MADAIPPCLPQPTELSRQTLGQGKFLALETIHYRDRRGVTRQWESAERVHGRQAVLLIPWLEPSDRLLLIKQYRPPAKAEVIEFPAGIIDPGETPEQACHRELLEETGYHARLTRLFPPAFNSPGLSSEAVHLAQVAIDEGAPENQHVQARPDDGEDIEVLLVPRGELRAFLESHLTSRQTPLDSKVLAYLLALVG